MKNEENSNGVRPWPKTQRGSAPSPAASPRRSAHSADPSVSERLLLLARPSLNTKNRSCILAHRPPNTRQDIFKLGRMVKKNMLMTWTVSLPMVRRENAKLGKQKRPQEVGGDINISNTYPTWVLFYWSPVRPGLRLALLAKLNRPHMETAETSRVRQHACESFSNFPTALCPCPNFSRPFLVHCLPATPTWSGMQQQARMSQCVKNGERQGPAMCKSDYATNLHWSTNTRPWGYRRR